MPARQRCDLIKIEIVRALDWRKSGELKNRIGKAEQREDEPDAGITREATQSVAQRDAHRIETHQQQITAA